MTPTRIERKEGDPIDMLHRAMWSYIDFWRGDRTGPWWEADLSLDIGCMFKETFGKKDPVEVKPLPSFLGAWPQKTVFRRFGTNNHFPTKSGRGMLPDHYYRNPNTDTCEWIVELKVCSLGGSKLENEIEGCIKALESDAQKCRKWIEEGKSKYAFFFLAANIPAEFEQPPTYTPDQFLEELMSRLANSDDFRVAAAGDKVDLCVAIKRIDALGAELVGLKATPRFRESPHLPQGVSVCLQHL